MQQERFQYQQRDRSQGDEEAQQTDETFMDALKYGLPPTGGFGLGVERLIMFMSNHHSIREVLPFPPVSDGKNAMQTEGARTEQSVKII